MPNKPPTDFVYTRESNSTGWFVGIIVALALLAIAYLVFSANSLATAHPARVEHQSSAHVKIINEMGGHGSGVHIGDGYILTAHHVLVGYVRAQVKSDDGAIQTGEVLWSNSKYDVALIRADKYDLATAPLNCAPSQPGQHVTLHGNPEGLEFVYTAGEIVGLMQRFGGLYEGVPVNAAFIPGQSGGGLIGDDGSVVGIASQALVTNFGIAQMGLMVPSTTICRLMGRN